MPTFLKLICLTLALCAFIADISTCQQTSSEVLSDSLSLHLHFDTTQYLFGQNIIAHVTLKNNSGHPTRVIEIRYSLNTVTIDNKSGTKLSTREVGGRFGKMHLPDPVTQLPAGDSLTTSFFLCNDYGLAYEVATGAPCLATGKTLIRANYLNKLFTPYTSIEVDIPTDDEAVTYELYRRASLVSRTKGYEPCISILDSLITAHSQSRYIPEVCKLAIYLGTAAVDSARVSIFGTRLIRLFPNHPYAGEAVDRILRFLPSSASFCDSIATAYPNTRVGIHAREKLALLKAEKR